jgi:hypothetical protein
MIKIEDRASWFFNVGELRMTKVRDWYMEAFPDDDLGPKLDKDVTMWDVVGLLNAGLGKRFYDLIGEGDSVIRERVFWRISKIVGCDYDDVYFTWLGREDRPVISA